MRSLRVQFMAFTAVLLVILLLLLNIFPITSSRDRVFEEKRNSLSSQAAVVASSLANLDSLSRESISDVLQLLDISGFSRTVVVDAEGSVIYDDGSSADPERERGDIASALSGKTVFRSLFAAGAFQSGFAMPMSNQGTTVGAVYIGEHDAERAAMIETMQQRLRFTSLVIAGAATVIVAIFSNVLLRRIRELVESMRIVASGNYGYRLATRGTDEITELGEEFNMLTERLETTERQRRRFVSDASHELKTPLASIRLLSDSIVQSENMNESTVREFVTDIGQEAERLQRTTEKLLDLSRMDDDVRSDPEPVDVKQVAVDALVLVMVLDQVIKPSNKMYMLLTVLQKGSVYALAAVSMNLLNGFTGLFSLGHAGFMLIGAYTYAIFSIPAASRDTVYQYYDAAVRISFPEVLGNAMGGFGTVLGVIICVILAGLMASLFAYLIGLPVLRLKSDYLAIATLGFAEILRAIFQWQKLGPVTNGANMIKSFPIFSS